MIVVNLIGLGYSLALVNLILLGRFGCFGTSRLGLARRRGRRWLGRGLIDGIADRSIVVRRWW